MIIGITGGIGAGKSQVLTFMEEEFGAACYQLDEIAHQLMEPGHSCYEQLVDLFGEDSILLPDKRINREFLSAAVFTNPRLMEKVNNIVHPMVKEYILGEISCIHLEDPSKIIVIEAALLIEDHYDKICDEIWYIYTEEAVRRERLMEGRGYSKEKVDSIMKTQLSDQEFRKNCQKVIDNNGCLSKTREELKKALVF